MDSGDNGFGTCALVTGAASGMGRLYARKLARTGYSLILVDIAAEKLAETADEIRREIAGATGGGPSVTEGSGAGGGFAIRTLVCDLSRQEAASEVAKAAEGCEVEVLVNNAGIMYCQNICNTSRRALSLIMMLHNYTPLMLCREFVPKMIARGKGYVLNVSSLAAWMEWQSGAVTERSVRLPPATSFPAPHFRFRIHPAMAAVATVTPRITAIKMIFFMFLQVF